MIKDEWVNSLPETGEYTIKDCGQGEWALIAALVKKELTITATDKDKDKISIAQNCTSVPQNLIYKVEDTPSTPKEEKKPLESKAKAVVAPKEEKKKEEKKEPIETKVNVSTTNTSTTKNKKGSERKSAKKGTKKKNGRRK